MVMINSKTNFALEGVSYKYAGFILGVSPQTVSNWGKENSFKEFKGWKLYYNTRRLKKGLFAVDV